MPESPATPLRRMPAEWEPHAETLLGWPHHRADWPGKFQPIPWVFAEIVRHIVPHEPVRLLVNSDAELRRARSVLQRTGALGDNVYLHVARTDRGWMRDCAPFFSWQDEQRVAAHFAFNGWAKYDNYEHDAALPAQLAETFGMPLPPALHDGRHVVLEGGAIDINGRGTLITTEECLLDQYTQVRNPDFTREDYEAALRQHLGITNVIWLGHGIAGDDTHGHVDDLCRFVNEKTLLLCREQDPRDDNYTALQENWERLTGARLEDGSKPDVIPLPMPAPLHFEGIRLPASYANFYICNGAVLVPTFNDPNDRTALGILAELFPGRTVLGIHAVDLVWGFGTLHCLTHEVPGAL
jgi:agmatine deiminase